MSSFVHVDVRPLEGAERPFAAEVRGVALDRPLASDVLHEIRCVFSEYPVLAFPDQPLTLDELEAFTLQIGPFGEDPFVEPMPGHPNVLEVRRDPNERNAVFGGAWHSDWSFQRTPPAITLLHGDVIPPVGGDTLFADGAGAYDALSDAAKHKVAGLRGIHSASSAYGPKSVFSRETGERAMRIITGEAAEARQLHPLVRTHPENGRRVLFVNPVYTRGIDGLEPDDAKELLGALYAHMLEDRFLYRHRWEAKTLLMWDNRRVMHNAEGGYDGHLRVMHRTTVAGEVPA